MNARKAGLFCAIILSIIAAERIASATDQYDFLKPYYGGTQPVALMGGDTMNTYSVSVASNSAIVNASSSTLIIAARTARERRKICVQNRGAVTVAIGSSTVSTSNLFILGEATSTLNSNTYCTNFSGAIYGNALATAPKQTVVVLEEIGSNDHQ